MTNVKVLKETKTDTGVTLTVEGSRTAEDKMSGQVRILERVSVEGGQGKLVVRKVILAAAAITLWTATAQAQPGTATGAVTVNGRPYKLRCVRHHAD